MPAGDLITLPGQVEWDGRLIDVTLSPVGRWLSVDTGREGWQPRWSTSDAQTSTGGVSGLPVLQPMYPALLGVVCESASLLADLEACMVASYVPRPLVWWDWERDEVRSAPACPRRGEPRTAAGGQLMPHRLIDLQWFIGDPTSIEVVGGSS